MIYQFRLLTKSNVEDVLHRCPGSCVQDATPSGQKADGKLHDHGDHENYQITDNVSPQ